MKAYKGFNKDMTCSPKSVPFQYEEGKEVEGRRIIDMLKIVREQILPLEPHEFGERSTVVKDISVESVNNVLSEAIRVIKGCYFAEDEILEQKESDIE